MMGIDLRQYNYMAIYMEAITSELPRSKAIRAFDKIKGARRDSAIGTRLG